MVDVKRLVVTALALGLAVLLAAPFVMAKGTVVGGLDTCWQVYAKKVAEADRQYRDPGSHDSIGNQGRSSNVGAWHDAWTEAADELMDCIADRLGMHELAAVRMAHLGGEFALPHRADYELDNPSGASSARVWLFSAPLGDRASGAVPRVTVNGRVAFRGDEAPVDGPVVAEVPVLPGSNDISLATEPHGSVAAVVILEFLDD